MHYKGPATLKSVNITTLRQWNKNYIRLKDPLDSSLKIDSPTLKQVFLCKLFISLRGYAVTC